MQDALELKRLGEMYVEQGDYESAELLFRKVVGIDEQYAPDSVALSEDLYNLGLLCSALEKNVEARAFLMRAWEIERTLLGDSHAETLKTFNALNEVFYDQDSLSKEGQLYASTRTNKTSVRTYH
jgi:tetratricopeptide (TPR) repeat protein